jgi:hypothetical protein
MQEQINTYALKLEKPKKEDAKYELVFGAETETPIDWKPYLPDRERQWSWPLCVTFSRLNCGEAKAKRAGISINLSDLCLSVESGTTKTGNGLHAVSEWFRLKGTPKEEDCPWKEDWKYDPNKYWDIAFTLPTLKENAKRYKGGNHSWVADGIKDKVPYIKNALAHSPVQIGVSVGNTWEDAIVRPTSDHRGYHAVLCYHIDSEYIYLQDSIGREFKKLTLDYPILFAKSFRDLPNNWKEVQQNMQVKEEELKKLYTTIFHRDIDKEALGYVGHELNFILDEFSKSGEWKLWNGIIRFFKALKPTFIKFGKKDNN